MYQIPSNVPVAFHPPNVINLRCPACRHAGTFYGFPAIADLHWYETTGPNRARPIAAGVRLCPNPECRGVVFVVQSGGRLIESFPPERIDFDPSNLPAKILSSLEEAITCHAAGAHRASALMVRRVLEELCADRGAEGRDLKQRIHALSQSVIVPPDLFQAMDELRILGNDAAHIEAKAYDNIGKTESDLAIELAKELLKAVYQYASLVGRLRALKGSSGGKK